MELKAGKRAVVALEEVRAGVTGEVVLWKRILPKS